MKKTDLKKYKIWALAALGVLLMILPGLISRGSDKVSTDADNTRESPELYSERIEAELEELLSAAEGVGRVQVVVTLESTDERVLAQNESYSDSSYSTDYVIVGSSGSEEGIILKEIYPKVRGVAVVCDGGANTETKLRIIELISAALGISKGKIAVSP
ncbi:MAG: hypothetical protein E7575_04475 [Ruminococcaceae bacterium]|nr:hypothetical protein [Oscillospiraceae bacterium]